MLAHMQHQRSSARSVAKRDRRFGYAIPGGNQVRMRRASLAVAVVWAATSLPFPQSRALAAVDPTPGPDSEAFPITVEAKPLTMLAGNTVQLTGTTLALLNSDVVLTIAAPQSSPPQSVRLAAVRNADGSFHASYVPRAAGVYTVDAMAPDGRGHASASFKVENPEQLSQPTVQALADLAQDAGEIVSISRKNLANVPPSPARDQAEQKLDSLTQTMGELIESSNNVSESLGRMLPYTASLPSSSQPSGGIDGGSGSGNTSVGGNYSMGGGGSVAGNYSMGGVGGNAANLPPELAKVAADRDALVEQLGQASQVHQRTQQEIQKLKKEELTCDNLEKVSEGIKLVSGMFNFMTGPVGIAKNFAMDFRAAFVSDKITSWTKSAGGGFLAGEVWKNVGAAIKTTQKEGSDAKIRTVKLDVALGNAASFTNDVFGFLASTVMSAYCEQFTGPVTAHMHATFTDNGIKWWEYKFDVRGQLYLHYPKGASGGSVPLKGRIEGFANNYKVWDNALTVKYPGLMSSAVQKHAYILPVALNDSQAGFFQKISSVEGSILGQAVTPSSFMFEVHGTATKDQLNIEIGTPGHDTDNKARAIVLYAAVLSLSMGLEVYSLPFKPVHFIFEKAASTYTIDLTTQKTVVRGKQHFANEKTNGGAMGEYSVDIEACNPDC